MVLWQTLVVFSCEAFGRDSLSYGNLLVPFEQKRKWIPINKNAISLFKIRMFLRNIVFLFEGSGRK